MSLTKKEAVREIEKTFDVVDRKAPMLKGVMKELRKTILLIVNGIRTEEN
jgi:hypothetical protein